MDKNIKCIPGRRGSTLVLALWALLLLSIFAVQLGVIVRQKMTLVHRLDERDRRFRIAEAGVKRAVAELRKPDALYNVDFMAERWCDQSDLFKQILVGNGQFTVSYTYEDGDFSRIMYGLQDEESKININKAGTDVIRRLLELRTGMPSRNAEELAYNIVDWRDKDSFFQHPQFGAEDEDYRDLRKPYESKDGDYEVIDELLLIKDMTRDIFDKIKYFVTVHGEGRVNINTAPKLVLLAMGVQDYVAENVLRFRKGGDEIAGTGDDDIFILPSNIVPRLSQSFGLSPSEIASLSNLVAAGQFDTKSENFMIHSEGRLNHKDDTTTVVAVVDRTGKIKYWQEDL